MRHSWNSTPIRWRRLPIAGGIAVLAGLTLWKQSRQQSTHSHPDFRDGTYDSTQDNMPSVKGPWQVHVIGALPLRTISRIYGALNEYTLPVWFRVPGYKLYSWIFGVNLSECADEDLRNYRSLSEFFMRRLKDGVRPIYSDQYDLVSPADGRVVNFGYIENRRVEQVKGVTYSLDQLLSGAGQAAGAGVPKNPSGAPEQTHARIAAGQEQTSDEAVVDEREFANLNGLHYTVDQLVGGEAHANQEASGQEGGSSGTQSIITPHKEAHDASLPSQTTGRSTTDSSLDGGDSATNQHTLGEQLKLASQTFDASSGHWTLRGVPKPGNRMYFCVVYLAPGDYHRFHSPANWVVERRRHFAGELFSVSPYMTRLLKDLFVLNERVALLGRWKHGFFSYVPVGATNVGSIRINFDADLKTNSPAKRKQLVGEYSEATYAKSSALLQGKMLKAGEEMGGFWLGSTIVMIFEAPSNGEEGFHFCVKRGEKIKMGEPLGKIGPLPAEAKVEEVSA